jgi:hypothetical protein
MVFFSAYYFIFNSPLSRGTERCELVQVLSPHRGLQTTFLSPIISSPSFIAGIDRFTAACAISDKLLQAKTFCPFTT